MMKLEDNLLAHYLNPDFSNNFLNDVENQIHVEMPYPIHRPFKNHGIDIIHKFHEDIANYSAKLATLRKDFLSVKDRIMVQKFNDSHITITKGILDFTKMDKCTVPFTCDYNPYYGTGLMDDIYLNNIHYLIRPDYKNNLRITNILNPWKSSKLKINNVNLDGIQGISSVYFNNDNLLVLRHKNKLNLVQIQDIDIGEIKWKKKFKGNLLDGKFNDGKMGAIFSNTDFWLCDIESNKKLKVKDNISGTNFIFIDTNNIAILNQNCLKILDCRSGDYRLFDPKLDNCNTLCTLKINDNFIYLGTRHYLIRTDQRFLKNIEYCTHLMKFSPCYMDLVESEDNKFLCLSSQSVGDKVLFNGSPIGSLPWNIPNICDTLYHCRLKNDILLKDKLNERFQASTGGIKLICDNKDVCIYTVNCFGEIFKQKISKISIENDNAINSLRYWMKKLPEPPKTLYPTNVANLSNARFALNKRIMGENLEKFTKKSKKATLFLNHFNNIYNNQNLGDLAANFASIWDEEEEGEDIEDMDLVPEVPPIEKVTSWIESNYFYN